MSKPKILVAGATGFVGSHALETLLGCDDVEVIAAVRDPSRLLPGFHGEVRKGDLRDAGFLTNVLKDVDVVVNGLSWAALFKHRHESRELFLEPTLALINESVAQGVKRFINVSSTSAAAPGTSADPMSRGIPRYFWPHLVNVVNIENHMRALSKQETTMVNLRCGIFVGRRYGLGILPILLPRLKTHLVPWIAGGKTGLPMVDGQDIGQAIAKAASAPGLELYQSFNIVGPEVPSVREVITFLHEEFAYPKPHFSVPFSVAYSFAGLMEWLDRFVPFDPLVTRSIVHLMEETHANNQLAERYLGYKPQYPWKEAIRLQVMEMQQRQKHAMPMAKTLETGQQRRIPE